MTWEPIILTIFTGVVALGFLLQGLALLAISRKLRELSARLDEVSTRLTKQVNTLAAQADSFLVVVKNTAEKIAAVQENVSAISNVVHRRVLEVDAFLNEVTDAARLQIARLQDVMDTTSRRIDATIDSLQNAVITPIAEVQAIIRGIRTGFDVLFGRRRRSDRSHQDEEMFI